MSPISSTIAVLRREPTAARRVAFSLVEQMALYGVFHRDRRNRRVHALALPFILWSGLLPGAFLRLGVELGLVTPDIVKAADALQKRGTDPFFIGEGSPAAFAQRGQPRSFKTRVAFAYYQGILLELAEPGVGSDIFSSDLSPDGRTTVHHAGMYASDLAPLEARYAALDWVTATVSLLVFKVNVFILDARAETGLALEFLDMRWLGIPGTIPRPMLYAAGAVQDWTGCRVFHT